MGLRQMTGYMQEIRVSQRRWRRETTPRDSQFHGERYWPIIRAAGIKGE
jgi:hypothetical protein